MLGILAWMFGYLALESSGLPEIQENGYVQFKLTTFLKVKKHKHEPNRPVTLTTSNHTRSTVLRHSLSPKKKLTLQTKPHLGIRGKV